MTATPPPAPSAPEAPRTSRPLRIFLTVVVLGLVSMWVYVLYLAIGPGRADSPDKLAEPDFARSAQHRCDQAQDVIATLQPAAMAPDSVARADTLDVANDELTDMVADLYAFVPGGDDGKIVREWLADWETYLGDRRSYATALRTDRHARLLVSPKEGSQVTEFLDQFSKDNDMPACSTPTDAA